MISVYYIIINMIFLCWTTEMNAVMRWDLPPMIRFPLCDCRRYFLFLYVGVGGSCGLPI